MSRIFSYVMILSFAAAATGEAIEEPTVPMQTESVFKIGPGFIQTHKPYKGMDPDCLGIPMFIYKGEKLAIFGPSASYTFVGEDRQWGLQGLLDFRLEGYDDDDADILEGMSDRDSTLELGLRWMQNLDFAVMSLSFTHDILDEHSGYEISFSLRKVFRDAFGIETLTVTPAAGVNWRSKQLNDYYYGVRSAEAAAGRPAYDANGGLNYSTGIQLDYPLNEKWSLFGYCDVEWLNEEITESPIVSDHYSVTLILGTLYTF